MPRRPASTGGSSQRRTGTHTQPDFLIKVIRDRFLSIPVSIFHTGIDIVVQRIARAAAQRGISPPVLRGSRGQVRSSA
jgi:hypothetical protein